MNKVREQELVRLYRLLEPTLEISVDTKINNATIRSICMSEPAYKRVKMWLEKKLGLDKAIKQSGLTEDMVKARVEFRKCFELMLSRNNKYGDSYKVLSVQSIANLIEMKMNRIARLGVINTKALDEFQDCCNYAIFAIIKLQSKNE